MMNNLTARETEFALLARCKAIALKTEVNAKDQREANVFMIAAKVLESSFPKESKNLALANETYFAQHPNQRLSSSGIVKSGWVQSLPRLRDMLSRPA